MCGIVGIVAKKSVNQAIYDGLTVLQHRGQDAAGIVTCDENNLYLRKDNGLVRDVIKTRHMLNLKGSMGIGHVRYPTAGCSSSAEAQPFYVNSPYGICLAHNGNLVNTDKLRKIQINDYTTKTYKEFILIIKVIILVVALLMAVVMLNKIEILGNATSLFLIGPIIVIGVLYIMYRLYLLNMKDDKNLLIDRLQFCLLHKVIEHLEGAFQ